MTTAQQITEQQFTIGTLEGISEKSIVEHKKLYAGYVKHANLILEKITALSATTAADPTQDHTYAINEMQRRFGFEYNGVKNHEVYFKLLEGGAKPLSTDSALGKAITAQWGSIDAWQTRMKSIAMTRGIGWGMLYYDTERETLLNTWVDEQHLGQLGSTHLIFGIDMWEHSYMLDYVPSEKKKYVDAFFANVNWSVAENIFAQAQAYAQAQA